MTESDEIADGELLYRKIPVKFDWYDSSRNEVKPDAFRPTKYDTDGISVDRAWSESRQDFRRVEEAAQGRQSEYYIAVLSADALKKGGFVIVPAPTPDNPGHALITDLTHENRKDVKSQEDMVLLAHQLTIEVKGPFLSSES